ncbi:MAG TPA: hypothetical protein VMT23_03255 [Candidatus Binatia bacterium]|nr:hypothetical protein [Candidatus Binatia bacterium]
MVGFGILGLVICVIIALWPAMVASRKGHSFLLWFIISIPFWLISLFVVYFGLSDKTKTAQDIADDKAAEKALDREEKNA